MPDDRRERALRQTIDASTPAGAHVLRLLDAHGPGANPLLRLRRVSDRPEAGASRVGGLPGLMPGERWPMWDDDPLRFWGQLNYGDLAPVTQALGLPLPIYGVLQLFAPDGADMMRTQQQAVVRLRDPARLVRPQRAPPTHEIRTGYPDPARALTQLQRGWGLVPEPVIMRADGWIEPYEEGAFAWAGDMDPDALVRAFGISAVFQHGLELSYGEAGGLSVFVPIEDLLRGDVSGFALGSDAAK